MSYITDFAKQLVDQHHAELTVRDGQLHIWPANVWRHLSDDEREFIRNHRYALKALVRDGRQPLLPDDAVANQTGHPDVDR